MDTKQIQIGLAAIDAGTTQGYLSAQQASELKMQSEYAPLVARINSLKTEMNAVILAHSYQKHSVQDLADYMGDSYGLSLAAAETDADVIVFAGVHFMAETAKILNPNKTVLLPRLEAGCSLAVEEDAERLRQYKKENPDVAVMSYINTTAEVKSLSDIIFTSSNRLQVFDALAKEHDKILVMPDTNMYEQLKKRGEELGVEVYGWDGECVVHQYFKAEQVDAIRNRYSDVRVVVHPESTPGAVEAADYVGSTTEIQKHVRESDAKVFFIGTECEISAALQKELPDKKFVGACTLCPYMKETGVEDILLSMETMQHEILVPEDIATGARKALERMLEVSR